MSKRTISPARRGKPTGKKPSKPAIKVSRSKRPATKSKPARRKRSKPAATKAPSAKPAAVTRNSPPETAPPNPLASDDRDRQRTEHQPPMNPSGIHPQPDVEREVVSKRRRSLRHGAEI